MYLEFSRMFSGPWYWPCCIRDRVGRLGDRGAANGVRTTLQ